MVAVVDQSPALFVVVALIVGVAILTLGRRGADAQTLLLLLLLCICLYVAFQVVA